MTVSELVRLFDSPPSPPPPEATGQESWKVTAPRQARFLPQRTVFSSPAVRGPPNSPAGLPSTSSNVKGDGQLRDSLQVPGRSLVRDGLPLPKPPPSRNHESIPLIEQSLTGSSTVTASTHKTTTSDASTLVNRVKFRQHKPVPATAVFGRDAAPLHLAKLDEYLSGIHPPAFCPRNSKTEPHLFAPLDALAETGKSIDDLESNYEIPPGWKNSKTILGGVVNAIIGVLGSSALAPFYSLHGLFNTVQIFALILSTIVPLKGENIGDKWRKLFLGTIPNILAFNFASTLVQSLLYLLIFMAIAAGLLFSFWRSTLKCDRYKAVEGLQLADPQGRQWGLILVTFLLTLIYLPLSTMAVHVLVWSEDLWIIENPYVNATTYPPVVPPLGPLDQYRDPLDFCWTTTMKRNEVNYAPIIVILSAIVVLTLTFSYPLVLRRVIRRSVPKVDQYSELGRLRKNVELDLEYHRLLSRDRGPFSFLYSGFRRGWGTYESTYLFAKVNTLLIIAVINPDNCVFRTSSRTALPIVRQVLLVVSTIGFFLAQCVFAPFLDPINNASEWTSRVNYVLTSAVALAVTLNTPGQDVLNTIVLYIIYIVTYGLAIYFTVINLGFMHRIVKRLTRRMDFSIDIFSPQLDTSPSSLHLKRRIWQESVTTLLLTYPQCKIPEAQRMSFAQARQDAYPPYLLNFRGSPGERHVENLKILREIGGPAYFRAVSFSFGPDRTQRERIEDIIQKQFIGPDSYWNDPENSQTECTHFFGNAWWIPFPPTLVMKYDEGPLVVLQDLAKLEIYAQQNLSRSVQRKRQIRMSIRALDNRVVRWPYEHNQPIGAQTLWCCGRGRYNAMTRIPFHTCVLRLKRQGNLEWRGLHCGSGFSVELEYARDVKVPGEIIGLNEDLDLTPQLARFLELNQDVIDANLPQVEEIMSDYRRFHRKEYLWKNHVLSYQFLSSVYDKPQEPRALMQYVLDNERDSRVHEVFSRNEDAIEAAYDRLSAVTVCEASTWWYLFWDDLWRRNYLSIPGLQTHAKDFNPHYNSSIAYTPLPRAELERFLSQRGLLARQSRWGDFFHSGFLNKVYLRLNDAVFRRSNEAILFHVGDGDQEFEMANLDAITRGPNSTLGTGGGTNHDDSTIRPRPIYRWEGILDDPIVANQSKVRKDWFAKFGAWFGITPLWREGPPTHGVSLDVRLVNGRYELLQSDSL
ncbi:hypothetical protein BDN72DRAFT_953613 [Pluteus cervinus]|uniref:Uncharacterized protein n=1 Tax=Pluteus cervinus TaxID=181527 RepID=A0ACD3BGG6_9AGAR|nr:hypothetical protein BDN72DRAFT_953613 [Pluteus cervinus]